MPYTGMFRLKQLKNSMFYVNLCTNIWIVCNLTVPLHPKIQND